MIKKQDDGRWLVVVAKRHPKSRRQIQKRKANIPTQKEAHRIRDNLLIEIDRELRVEGKPNWVDALELWKVHAGEKGMMAQSIRDYCSSLASNTFDKWQFRSVNEITTDEIRSLILVDSKHLAEGTRKNLHKHLRSIFQFALEMDWVSRNPVPVIKFRRAEKLRGVLSQQEATHLLNLAKDSRHPWYPHWATALATGMRSGELYALTWNKVDLEKRLIKVDLAWNRLDGFKSTKSGHDRMVEFPPWLLPILRDLKLTCGGSEFVLPRSVEWERSNQAQELRVFMLGNGLQPIRFHDLRASWATMLLSKGVAPAKVMTAGGWRDLKTMMIYCRKAGVDIQGISDSLGELHDPAQERGRVVVGSFGARN